MRDVETPAYEIVASENNIEIRRYEPMIVAEVQMDGKRSEALSNGFRLLADYIFNRHTVKQDIAMTAPVQQQKRVKIAMTAPVQQQKVTKIPMTAPVQQQSSGESWTVSFVMPSSYRMETLPKPFNDRVTLRSIPAKLFVVIKFSGTNSDDNLKEHQKKLTAYINSKNLSVVGHPKYAFYNPPWTLPPMRRNEVMFEVEQ